MNKKDCVITVVLFALTFDQVKGRLDIGEQCERQHCIQQRGYIGYGGNVTSRRTNWRLLSEHGQFTTFVLMLKNVQMPPTQLPWLYIGQEHYRLFNEYRVDKNEERLFVFKDTKEVQIRLLATINLSFKLEFYVGCEAVEARDITIARTSSEFTNNNPFQNGIFNVQKKPTSCWFVIPTIREQIVQPQNAYWEAVYRRFGYFFPVRTTTNDIEIQETYLAMQNVSLANNTVRVIDLLTENELITVTGEENFALSVLPRNNVSVIKYVKRDLSSLIFINLELENERLPSETEFTLKGKALQQSELDCMERESKCRFNIGQKNFSCTPPDIPPELLVGTASSVELTQTACPGFDDIFSSILVLEPVLGPRAVSRCKRHKYCRTRKCGKLRRRQCRQECYLYKNVYKMCRSRSIFA